MNLEKPFLAILFCMLLFFGAGSILDNRLVHEFPYGYFASDTFQQQTRAQGIADAGNYRYEPMFEVKGYRDVIGYYPPLIHHQATALHFLTQIPVYDTIYFAVFLNAALAALVMYIFLRSYNKSIALLSLPLSLLLFSIKLQIGFTWGHWASITAQLLLITLFWILRRIDLEKSYILLGIIMGGLALAHASELLYAVWFVGLFCIYLLFSKQLSKKTIKNIAGGAIIALIISGYHLFVFSKSFLYINPYHFEVSLDWGGTPIFYLSDFLLLGIILIIGGIIGLFTFKKMPLPFLAGIFMVFVGYTNYMGFGLRAYQVRLLWPIYLAFFFGAGLYFFVQFIPPKIRQIFVVAIGLLCAVALAGVMAIPSIPSAIKITIPGLMSPNHWQMFEWISENTDPDAKIYFFYGDVYDQDAIMRNSKRLHGQITPESLIAHFKNGTIARVYGTEFSADHGAGMPYYKSFLNIGVHQREEQERQRMFWQGYADVCQFDYFVFDKVSRSPPLVQYNFLIAQELQARGATLAYQNDWVFVMKNNNINQSCIEEKIVNMSQVNPS